MVRDGIGNGPRAAQVLQFAFVVDVETKVIADVEQLKFGPEAEVSDFGAVCLAGADDLVGIGMAGNAVGEIDALVIGVEGVEAGVFEAGDEIGFDSYGLTGLRSGRASSWLTVFGRSLFCFLLRWVGSGVGGFGNGGSGRWGGCLGVGRGKLNRN